MSGIKVILPHPQVGISTAAGTRFFLEDGTEIKGIMSFAMPTIGRDEILSITITLPLLGVIHGV